ncbi:hypothetical protein JCM8097_004238 [Rhodosporidiobolus ruineniae]
MSTEKSTSRLSLVLHACGLITIYSLYGVLQEKIMKSSTYGPNNEHFTSSSLLIVFNRFFSVSVGLAILLYKSRQQPEHGGFVQRLKPASPYFAYASVAVFNFLSTSCQYQALRFVSYTTQSLAKTSKMVPVLVVGALVWKKKYAQREWVAGAVILAGCATYLFSTPPTPHGSHAAASAENANSDLLNGLAGAFFLVGYLFFDGLVSTTQEKVFGKNPSSSDPFGPDSPVLDQMVWTNVFACIIAVVMSLASTATGGFWNNLELLLTSGPLLWDVCVFSGASAIGLIILLNTIASFGALTSSLIMTIRQFLSILINAYSFGTFSQVSMLGWTGVFWVASGIWIKINKKYDPPKQPKVVFDAATSEESQSMLTEKGSPAATPRLGEEFDEPPSRSSKIKQITMQYIVPCAIPVVGAILLSPFLSSAMGSDALALPAPAAPSTSTTFYHAPPDDSAAAAIEPVQLGTVETPSAGLAAVVGSTELLDEENDDIDEEDAPDSASTGNTDLTEVPTAADQLDENLINGAEAEEAAALSLSLEGGSWDEALHKAVSPSCRSELVTRPYRTSTRTIFASYPRSGNSYLRSLIERSTGYQTSSVYCDKGLQETFVGECDHSLNFFVKSHFPALSGKISKTDPRFQQFYAQYDQAVHVVRNPLDAIISWYHLSHSPRTKEGFQDHENKLDIDVFDENYRKPILDLAERWRRHTVYWQQAPILTASLRYEDLKAQPIPNMMSLLSFLLPDEDLPPLQDVACIAEHHDSLQPYKSRRRGAFATWSQFSPALRADVLRLVRRPFCAFGYQRVLLEALGEQEDVQEAMDGFCDEVRMQDDEFDEHAESWARR